MIFAQTPEQRAIAQEVIKSLDAQEALRPARSSPSSRARRRSIPAEGYHQDYFERNGGQPYCMVVVAPKVAKFRKAFAERLKRPRLSGLRPRLRVSQPPAARHTPTDQNTGVSPTVAPSAPNASGTATAIACTSDMRTPAASPMRPGGAWLCSSDITIGWLMPSPSPRLNDSAISVGAECENGNSK